MPRIHIPDDEMSNPFGYVASSYAQEMVAAAFKFSGAVYEHTKLSLREMEAARMRTAQINGCTICMQGRAHRDFNDTVASVDGKFERPMTSRGAIPDEDFYGAIDKWQTSDLFSDRERIAIEYAERLGERPRSMQGDEAFWSRVKAHFSDDEIVDMTTAISSWIALGRFTHTLELDSVCYFDTSAASAAE
ncbi:MAG: carboxymuconolactone decarboxylase family protein [Pseudomonadota bacterium]